MPLTWPRIQLLGSSFGHFGSTVNAAGAAVGAGESPLDPVRTSGEVDAQAESTRTQAKKPVFEGMRASVSCVDGRVSDPGLAFPGPHGFPARSLRGTVAWFSLPRSRMDQLLSETRYGLGRMCKSPGFSVVVIVALALGIGANSAIFSVVDAVLLQRLRFADPERLVTIRHHYPTLGPLDAPISAPGFRDYRDRTQSFSGVAVETGTALNLTGTGDPERVQGAKVSGDWFRVLAVSPALGRSIEPDDDVPGKNVAVLSDALWHRLFGGSADVLGKTLQLDGVTYTVVGVMPKGFRGFWSGTAEMWLPLSLPDKEFERTRYTNEWLNSVARLKPGVSLQQAQEEMTRFGAQVQKEMPSGVQPIEWTLQVDSLQLLANKDIKPALLILLGAVGFVLLIACANV